MTTVVCPSSEVTAPSMNRSGVSVEADTSEAAKAVPYKVIYGPGTVIRKDLAIESDKVVSVPCGEVIDIHESSAVPNSEGVVRVRASYGGLEGWTSYKTRDGVDIIDRCEAASEQKSTVRDDVVGDTPPTTPTLKKSKSKLSGLFGFRSKST